MRHIRLVDYVPRNYSYRAAYRQGDVDGACGIYCLIACLDLCGLVRDLDVDDLAEADEKTGLGKVIKKLGSYDVLFKDGLTLDDLNEILLSGYADQLSTEVCHDFGSKARKFVLAHLEQGHPVILGLEGEGGMGHWVVAAGLESFKDATGTEVQTRLFLLDPAEERVDFCLWNAFVSLRPAKKGRFPYLMSDDHYVRFDGALAVCPTVT